MKKVFLIILFLTAYFGYSQNRPIRVDLLQVDTLTTAQRDLISPDSGKAQYIFNITTNQLEERKPGGSWLPFSSGGSDGVITGVTLNGSNNLDFTGSNGGFNGIIDLSVFALDTDLVNYANLSANNTWTGQNDFGSVNFSLAPILETFAGGQPIPMLWDDNTGSLWNVGQSETQNALFFEDQRLSWKTENSPVGAQLDATGNTGVRVYTLPDASGTIVLDSQLATAGTDDQTASEVPFTPDGSLSSTDVQSAIQELRDETLDDQIASQVDITDTADNYVSTTVEGALVEIASQLGSGSSTPGKRNLIIQNETVLSTAYSSNEVNGTIDLINPSAEDRQYPIPNDAGDPVQKYFLNDDNVLGGVTIAYEGAGMNFKGIDLNRTYKNGNNAVLITAEAGAVGQELSDGNLTWEGDYVWITVDLTSPLVSSATVEDGAETDLVVVFDEVVNITDTSGLSLDGSWSGTTITGVSGTGTNTLTFTLDTPIAEGETGNFVYSAANTITDVSGNALAASNTAITNNVIDSPPALYDGQNAVDPTTEVDGIANITNGGSQTLSSSIEQVFNGTHSLKVVKDASSSTNVYLDTQNISNGQSITITCNVYRVGTSQGNIRVFLDDAEGWSTDTFFTFSSTVNDGTWVLGTVSGTATQDNPRIRILHLGTTSGDTYYLDNISYTVD